MLEGCGRPISRGLEEVLDSGRAIRQTTLSCLIIATLIDPRHHAFLDELLKILPH
jgi:hypothetical protein